MACHARNACYYRAQRNRLKIVELLRGGLVVSCQAPENSPLDNPKIIAALARAAETAGAVAVRINGPKNIRAARAAVRIPIVGIYKQRAKGREVYITPTFEAAAAVRRAGADIVALDATSRPRPGDATAAQLIARVRRELRCAVMADVASLADGVAAAAAGADLVATTLFGYTRDTAGRPLPGFDLLAELVRAIKAQVVCEGGINQPAQVAEAFRRGAFAVVVGTAITGIEARVRLFAAEAPRLSYD